MTLAKIFGDKLQDASGEVSTEGALKGKYTFIYFSAHWCPPCRGFTPKLAEFYRKHKESKGFEVVFVSSDRSDSDFADYFKEMPWLALPYADREAKDTLSKQFKVQGIPFLVLLEPDGKVVTTNGRQKVMADFDTCENFPWKPPTVHEALGASFVKKDGSTVGKEAIEGKTLGLYFSAHWCPPCRNFTPKLKDFYNDLKSKGGNFEMIFLSSDKSEGEMLDYFKNDHADYLALPYEKRKEKDALNDLFEVQGIPTLVVLDASGAVINANARGKITAGADVVLKEGWEPPAVGDLAEGPEAAGSDINETPTIVMLCEQCSEETKRATKDAADSLAKEYIKKSKASGDPIQYIFLMGSQADDCDQLKALTKKDAGDQIAKAMEGDKPLCMLFDIQDDGGFYVGPLGDVTTDSLRQFLDAREKKEIPRMQLSRG